MKGSGQCYNASLSFQRVMELRWEEIISSRGTLKTDPLLYSEKAYLLLPSIGGENRFMVVSSTMSRRFYIASDSLSSMERLRTFFFRVYGMVAETSSPPDGYNHHFTLQNSRRNRKIGEFYHPGFLRNIIDVGSLGDDMESMYLVSIRSGHSFKGTTRFNFTARVSFIDAHKLSSTRDILLSEIRQIRKRWKWRFHTGSLRNTSDNILADTTNLINFIRIPAENDFVV